MNTLQKNLRKIHFKWVKTITLQVNFSWDLVTFTKILTPNVLRIE